MITIVDFKRKVIDLESRLDQFFDTDQNLRNEEFYRNFNALYNAMEVASDCLDLGLKGKFCYSVECADSEEADD